jgi:hypothetical protein
METGHEDGVKAVSMRRVHIGPHSARIVVCDLDCELDDFIVEPVMNFPSGVVVSRAFNSAGKSGRLCILNLSGNSCVFKKGKLLGTAVPADEVSQAIGPV